MGKDLGAIVAIRINVSPLRPNAWLSGLVVTVGLLFAGSAQADGSRPIASTSEHGVHLGKDGHHYREICPANAKRHCFARKRLPDSYVPQNHHPVPQPGFCDLTSGGGGGTNTTPPAGSMTPTDIQKAYGIPSTSAAHGQIVALVDMPDSNAFQELTTYRQAFGLPALPQCPNGLPDGKTPCFAAVDQNGNPNANTLDCPSSDGETGLDMDMISAACPDCSILLVQMTAASQTDGPSDSDFVTSTQTAIKLGAVATSISFGGLEGEGGPDDTAGPDPTGYTTPGHLVLASSGDSGYLQEGSEGGGTSPSYPASSPDVLAVGGTTLTKAATGYTEAVWDDEDDAAGSSGCSTEFPMPAYQTAFGATKFGSCTMRASVDVSAAAEYSPGNGDATQGGIAAYDAFDGFSAVTGTSAAAPLVAALFVRIGIAVPISKDFGFVYKNAASFNDITTGNNDPDNLCNDLMCIAGPGWDGPTGMGTPNVTKLAALVAPPPAATTSTTTNTSTGDDDDDSKSDSTKKKSTPTETANLTANGCAMGSGSAGFPTDALLVFGAIVALGSRRRRRSTQSL